jgi:tetratricopeptide (TPR) repeat protein
MTGLSRPQPLGVLPLPAGWLVVPADVADRPDVAHAVRRLLAGHLPDPWPGELEAMRLALFGDVEAAAARVDPAEGAEHAYDHFVLTGEPSSLELARATASGQLAALVEVAAFALGHADALPDAGEGSGLDGELGAHVLTAHAAARLEQGDAQGALNALVAAEAAARPVSPVLAATLLGQQAALAHQVNGADGDVVAAYREAVDMLRGAEAVETVAGELALGLATALQELAAETAENAGNGNPLLVQAIQAYHLALRLLRKESQPERYAFAHSNLALAYLAMPMVAERDKLRRGVAVQSLREALTFYTPAEHPREWASITLNLANALQHLPTTHPVENLVEAVGMYDELLEVRTADADPLGHARVLANQGTALGHLGIHGQARLKLLAAQEIFTRHGDGSSASTVREALVGIDAAAGRAASDGAVASAAAQG